MPEANDHYCFACGARNPIGLHLRFSYGEGTAEARFTPEQVHEGYPGLMHGGLVATLLDEAMAHAVIAAHGQAATGDLRVRMRAGGVPVGKTVVLRGQVTGRRGRMVMVVGRIQDEGGKVLAEGEAKFMLMEGLAQEKER
jgi:acyl-coenzyme A thioesterase PaaI-like protein